jgi:hypothetical protein
LVFSNSSEDTIEKSGCHMLARMTLHFAFVGVYPKETLTDYIQLKIKRKKECLRTV